MGSTHLWSSAHYHPHRLIEKTEAALSSMASQKADEVIQDKSEMHKKRWSETAAFHPHGAATRGVPTET